jgi:hypothetical protein
MGIYGDPRGTTGGVVWGAARDRQGKVATTRAYVIPTNPQTGPQTIQRNKFVDSLGVVRNWGPAVYLDYFDRSVGQLPGFQSMMSILLRAIDASYEFTAPPDTPLGALHFPDTYAVATAGAAQAVDVSWSAELGPDGTLADKLQLLACEVARDIDDQHPTAVELDADTRNGSPFQFDLPAPNTAYLIAGFWVGVGDAVGKISRVEWRIQNSGST